MTLAFDIETCPLPEAQLSAAALRRLDMEHGNVTLKRPDLDAYAGRRLAASTHPSTAWICCIAVAHEAQLGALAGVETRSWAAETPDAEADMLHRFWAELPKHHNVVSFNGKRFDSPFLLARSLRHAIAPPGSGASVLHRHRWQNSPHWDLLHAFDHPVTLADVCELLGVATPKGDMDGSMVAGAVAEGRIADVARYCEADTRATLECAQALVRLAPMVAR